VDETFEGEALDATRWLPYYLPHWSSRERAAARYTLGDGTLRLLVEADQEPWCPEWDGDIRVSSLQTGAFAGAVGTPVGQHRFHPDAVVREPQPNVHLCTPRYARAELRARFSDDPRAMGALWLIGYEDVPQRSAEICVCEIFGRDVAVDSTVVGVGIHPFGDPSIVDDFSRVDVAIDAREFHVYAADWSPEGVVFSVDGETIKTVEQSPDYAMQLMLSLYDFPSADTGGRVSRYPRELVVDFVRVADYSPV
jgi:glycosyl hydrolase family 16